MAASRRPQDANNFFRKGQVPRRFSNEIFQRKHLVKVTFRWCGVLAA